MKASELVQKDLNDGDTIVLELDVENVINRCCECGMLHHIRITRSKEGIIRMTWNRIDGDPEIESPRKVIIEEANPVVKQLCNNCDHRSDEYHEFDPLGEWKWCEALEEMVHEDTLACKEWTERVLTSPEDS
jgi:hypothetical protein